MLEAALGEPIAEYRPTYVRYSPGRSATVSFSVFLENEPARSIVAAYTGGRPPAGATVVGTGDAEIAAWRFPFDPALPGLALAADAQQAERLLGEVGVTGPVRRIRTRSYRPRRRAVIELETDTHRLFMKVVRPSKVAALQECHRAASDHLRVPHSLGFSEELGIAVLEPIEGRTLRQAVGAGDEPLPDGAALARLLEALPPVDNRRPGIIERVQTHKAYLQTILPDQSDRLNSLHQAIGDDRAHTVPAHNDFHSSQVLVAGSRISGLIDIDTLGPGCRADDYAMLLAHLHSLALEPGGDGYARYGASLLPFFEAEVGRVSLRRRIAGAMVGFATSPFRNQQIAWPEATKRRLNAAEEWLG